MRFNKLLKAALSVGVALSVAFTFSVQGVFALPTTGGPTYQQTVFGNTPTYGNGGTSQTYNAGPGDACATIKQYGFKGVVDCFIGLLNTAVSLMMALAVVYIVWGVAEMIRSEGKREEGKKIIYHGIIGLFVMISIWGLVNIFDKTFNLRGTPLPAPQLRP